MGFENARLVTVAEIQQKYFFRIPDYQRGYAWGQDQWQDLWDDLTTLIAREQGDHYGGTLMLRLLDESKNQRKYFDVVDGQQRLTTISLLLRALSRPHIDIDFKNNEHLKNTFDFFAGGKSESATRLEHASFYGKNMENAAKFFEAKVQEIDTDENKNAYTSALLGRFKLFALQIQPEFDIHIAFETINNRGKKLTVLERLKNRLIYLTSISADKDAGRVTATRIHDAWKAIYHWLGKGKTLLDDDAFLRAHSLGWFEYQKEAKWLESQQFEDAFSAHTPADGLQERIRDYVRSLETAAAWWFHLNEPAKLPPQIQRRLETFNRTSYSGFQSLLLWALVRLGSTDPLLVSDPSRSNAWSDPFGKLLEQAERFAILIFMGNGRKSNYAQGDLNWVAYWFAHPDIKFSETRGNTSTEASSSVGFASEYIKSIIGPQADGHFQPGTMRDVAADLLRSKNGYYGWDFAKLVIYEWELALRGEKGQIERAKPWEKFSWDETVEHIYPQKPDGGWTDDISFDKRTSQTLRDAVTNSLGNLLLLSRSRNASVSNGPYRGGDKPQSAKSVRYKSGSYSEVQVAEHCPKWNILTIAARGIALMRFAEKRWEFKLVESDDLTSWLPILFGDQADNIQARKGSNKKKELSRTRLNNWVSKFETHPSR